MTPTYSSGTIILSQLSFNFTLESNMGICLLYNKMFKLIKHFLNIM